MGQGKQVCLGAPLYISGTGIGTIYPISEGKNESHGGDV